MVKTYDVFISYHGGKGDDSRSSYGKAEELYNYLSERGFHPFLYKKVPNGNFYHAIVDALLCCRHFILVAQDSEMLSEWVRDEVCQFDGLRKEGRKPHCLISAYIYGGITESDLIDFNPLFTAWDIAKGEGGFERLYSLLRGKENERNGLTDQNNDVTTYPRVSNCNKELEPVTADSISCRFIGASLKNYRQFSDEDYKRHCSLLTERLKCMSLETIPEDCTDIIGEEYRAILERIREMPYVTNVMKISGQSGTQKSYVMQMLYITALRSYPNHDLEPVYLHCEYMSDEIEKQGITAESYLGRLFGNFSVPDGRRPLFFVDGVRDCMTDEKRIDFAVKKVLDRFEGALYIVGVNRMLIDNPVRANKSAHVKGKYELGMTLTPISLYDTDKCIRYIHTLPNLPMSPEEVYRVLNGSGLLTINEFTTRKVLSAYESDEAFNIMTVYEDEILDYLDGDEEQLQRGAEFLFEFAYGSGKIDYNDPLCAKLLKLISRDAIYMNCLMAIHFCNKLDEFEESGDFAFFSMVWPKEVTRFITKKINERISYESIIVSLAEKYYRMTPMGQSELSFFLGRIKTPALRTRAINYLIEFYHKTKQEIQQRTIDKMYNGKTYTREMYRQDLFLFRGLSVSLIYCGNAEILRDYIRSLIDNDVANSINRGFHLEYYGDKKYMPNQNTLDYEDNLRVGERTLRVLCNSVATQMKSGAYHPAFLLDLFTIVSILQARMEAERGTVRFDLVAYIRRASQLVGDARGKWEKEGNVIRAFFEMAQKDFDAFLAAGCDRYSPARRICNEFLAAKDVKRAGWVMQNIEHPESIVEHMYSCWFIGLVFLPSTCDGIPGYDKQKILNMLIVHDLAETRLSDIPKYEKINYPDYDLRENFTMLEVLLKGTYGTVSAIPEFVEAWDAWYMRSDENARIAKDIDTIQAIYQFLMYNNSYPDKFDEERKINWLREINVVTTDMGRKILEELILNNELFRDTFEKYKQW